MKTTLLTLLAILLGQSAHPQSSPLWGNLEAGQYQVGFNLITTVDDSRSARRIALFLWYPAQKTDVAPLRFRTYADDTDHIPIARGLSADRLEAILNTSTAAFPDAPPGKGKFPLIVFAQGLYYESPVTHAILCEYLASHGYVVATCPLVGTHSPQVRLDLVDLETQVRDLEFIISKGRSFDEAASN